jgi:hypothetical protein
MGVKVGRFSESAMSRFAGGKSVKAGKLQERGRNLLKTPNSPDSACDSMVADEPVGRTSISGSQALPSIFALDAVERSTTSDVQRLAILATKSTVGDLVGGYRYKVE